MSDAGGRRAGASGKLLAAVAGRLAGPFSRSLLDRAEPLLDRVGQGAGMVAGAATRWQERVGRWLAPDLMGFRRHQWTGRLFLISGTVSAALMTLGALALGAGAAMADTVVHAIAELGVAALALVVTALWWRLLRGIARFELGARDIAVVLLFIRIVFEVWLLTLDLADPIRTRAFLVVDLGLSAQFFAHFLHTRRRYLSAEERAASEQALDLPVMQEPAADAG
jgi:hypothetical protein